MRDGWMHDVDDKQAKDHEWIMTLDNKLDNIAADTLELKIENKRETIISFASFVIDERNLVTRAQFNRIFRLHDEYEAILEENELTNGETDTAMAIIRESYAQHMRNHTFVENLRGYDSGK